MSKHYETDFPFEEIRDEHGDYFRSIDQAMAAGFHPSQIWSVTECDNWYTYGPPGHIVNLIGYVATNEQHDGDTYYEEQLSFYDEEE